MWQAYDIILRFVLNGKITHRLIALKLLRDPILGTTLASLIHSQIHQTGVAVHRLTMGGLVSFSHDRASVNTDAANHLRVLTLGQSDFLQAPCVSHTIDNRYDRDRQPTHVFV